MKKINELRKLVTEFGYWSNEVNDFNSKLQGHTMMKLNNIVLAEIKSGLL